MIIENIKQHLGNLEVQKPDDNPEEKIEQDRLEEQDVSIEDINAQNHLSNAINCLPDDLVKSVIINEVLNVERRRYRKKGKVYLKQYIHHFVKNALDETEQKELLEILKDLPSAVLGDNQSREQTRVLVDIYQDIRHGLSERRRSNKNYRNLIDIAGGIIQNQIAKRPDAATLLCHVVKKDLSKGERFRAVMAQLLLSKIIPVDKHERDAVFIELFPTVFTEENVEKKTEHPESESDIQIIPLE